MISSNYYHLIIIIIICFHTVIGFHAFLSNNDNYQIYFQTDYEILKVTTTTGQSGPGSNGNEEVFHTPQSSKTGTSPLNAS